MARRLLKEHIKTLFARTKASPYWLQIKRLPLLVRYAIGVFLISFGLLGMFTPIPAGIVFLIIGIALFVGLGRARVGLLRLVHITRLHLLYSKIYMWWQLRKKKNPIQ